MNLNTLKVLMVSREGQGAPVPQTVTPSPPRHLSSLVAFAPGEPSRHYPVRLLMFTCMFDDCTRITTHRTMSALFFCIYLYIYIFFSAPCSLFCTNWLPLSCGRKLRTAFSHRLVNLVEGKKRAGVSLLLHPPHRTCVVWSHTHTHSHI